MSTISGKTSITSKFYIFLSIVLTIAIIDTFVLAEKFQNGSEYRNFSSHVSSIETEVLKLEAYIDVYLAAINVPGYTTEEVSEEIKEQSYILSKLIDGLFDDIYAGVVDSNMSVAAAVKEIDIKWNMVDEALLLFYGALTKDDTYLIHNEIDMNTSLMSDELTILALTLEDLGTESSQSGTRWLVFTLFSSFGFIAILSYFFIKRALKPLSSLAEKSSKYLSGDLSVRFDGEIEGDIGYISKALNKAREGSARGGGEAEPPATSKGDIGYYKISHMAALNNIITLAGRSVSEFEFYNKAIEETIMATNAFAGAVYMINFEKIELKVSKGFKGTFFEDAAQLPVEGRHDGSDLSRVVKVYSDLAMLSGTKYRGLLDGQGVKSLVCAPILRGDSVIGYFDIAFTDPGEAEKHVPFIEAVALSIGVVVGYTELFLEAHGVRRFLERLFDQQPMGMAIFDSSGRCSMANTRLKNIFGCSPGCEIAGRYSYLNDENFVSSGFLDNINKTFSGETSELEHEYNPSLAKGFGFLGAPVKVIIKSLPLYDSSGNIENVMLTFSDSDLKGNGSK